MPPAVFYFLFVLTCLGVLVDWERKRMKRNKWTPHLRQGIAPYRP